MGKRQLNRYYNLSVDKTKIKYGNPAHIDEFRPLFSASSIIPDCTIIIQDVIRCGINRRYDKFNCGNIDAKLHCIFSKVKGNVND